MKNLSIYRATFIFALVITLSLTVGAVIHFANGYSQRLAPEYKIAIALEGKLKGLPRGTVFLSNSGEVYLLDYASDYIHYSHRTTGATGLARAFNFAKSVVAFYTPDSNGDALKERSYLLEMFAQNKRVPPDWKITLL